MISKNQISFIRSLSDKKQRLKYACFVAEGNKIAIEILNSNWAIEQVYATQQFVDANTFRFDKSKINVVTKEEIERISHLQAPTDVVIVLKIPTHNHAEISTNGWSLALDGIQDPGNFGTIIRTADWFGIKQIFASPDCADLYNSKTIQATMGSFLRMKVQVIDLEKLIAENKFEQIAVAVMNGENISKVAFAKNGLMILGSEGKGVSKSIIEKATHPVTITGKGTAESLNVAVAAGIICSRLPI